MRCSTLFPPVIPPRWLTVVASLMVFVSFPARLLADEDTAPGEGRLEGYVQSVKLEGGGGSAMSWMLFLFLLILAIAVFFKNSQRTHLD